MVGCTGAPTAPTPSPQPPGASSALAEVLSVRISPAVDTIALGETVPFTADVVLGDGIPPSGPLPIWSSSNTAVLQVGSNGAARALAPGDAILELIFKGHRATRTINVVR